MHGSPKVQRRLLRVSEVAEMLGVAEGRVRELIATGAIRSVRLGGDVGWHRVPVGEVERLIGGESVVSPHE